MENNLKTRMEEVVKRIADAGIIAVVLPEAPGLDAIGSAAALVSGLRALGKTVSVFAPPVDPAPGRSPALVPWGALGADGEALREFILSFDLTRSPIKELKYERDENRLNIILSPTGRIRREDVEFRWGDLRYELVIAVGAPSPEALAPSIRRAPELVHEKPVLNIDASPANTRYGELNLVPDGADAADPPTLAELTHDLLAAMHVPGDDPERASALFAALAAATGTFRPERTGPRAFRLAGELRSRGADPAALRRLAAYRPAPGLTQLVGRAMARSRHEPELDLLWAFLTSEDFAKTGTDAAAMSAVLEHVRLAAPLSSGCALLWQDTSGAVRALLETAPDRTHPPLRLEETFPSFGAAEAHIRQLLRRNDGVE